MNLERSHLVYSKSKFVNKIDRTMDNKNTEKLDMDDVNLDVEYADDGWTTVGGKSKLKRQKKEQKKYFKKNNDRILFHSISRIKNYNEKREYSYYVQQTTGDISFTARTLMNDLRCHDLERDGWMVTRIEESRDTLPGDDQEQYVPFKSKDGQDYWIVFSKDD